MVSKLVEEQLRKVQYADLSKYCKEANTFVIKKREDIKIEEDKGYLIKLNPSAFNNQAVIVNWNGGSMPKHNYLKIDVSKCMGKMIKIVGVGYDYENKQDLGDFWSGWLSTADLDVISRL